MTTATTTTMDFFHLQESARRKTSVLVVYYILAIALIMLAVYLAVSFVFIGLDSKTADKLDLSKLWNPQLFLWVVAGTAAIVITGTFFKIAQLSSGGEAVAKMLGGRPINPNTTDLNERKVLNVVEEMSIASGSPVPRVFMLDEEDGINAFAAGFSPSDAVIGVTRGCVQTLTRDELQGVIAHEFSHILNGDMRLNIRLIGVLNGILVIAIIGYSLMRIMSRSSSGSRSKGKGGAGALVLLGLLLMIIGYIGVFFGKLIKSAVSRQREYLADASSVQFTRNPSGIAGALKKIGGFLKGSKLETPKAEEASHLFFSNGLAQSFVNLMATHPPLTDRIRRIDPSFDGEFGKVSRQTVQPLMPETSISPFSQFTAAPARSYSATPGEVSSRVGTIRQENINYAAGLIGSLPVSVATAIRDPLGARAVIYSLLLSKEDEPRKLQLDRLAQHAGSAVHKEIPKVMPGVEKLGQESRLPVLDIAIASLKNLSQTEYEQFNDNIKYIVSADKEIDLFEYTLQRILRRHLEPSYRNIKPQIVQYYSIQPLLAKCGQMLSCLAYWGTDDVAEANKAFQSGIQRLKTDEPPGISPLESCGLTALDGSLNMLAAAAAPLKKLIIEACTACIGADGRVTLEEAELLRAIADSLDCPIPPFIAA